MHACACTQTLLCIYLNMDCFQETEQCQDMESQGNGAKASAVSSDTAQMEVLSSISSPSLLLTLGMESRASNAK